MAYTGVIVTSAEMVFFAGELVDATGSVEANWNYLADYAEAYLCALLKYDIVTNWASLNAVYKSLLTEWAARFGAIGLITYNMAGYTSRTEAEDMINVHWARMKDIEKLLKEEGTQNFIGT